jgi:hypothetical protein
MIIIIIIWGANQPYSQLRAELRRTRLHVFEKLAFKGAFGCQPHQPIMTTKHSQRSKVFDLKTLVAQQRTTHIWPCPGIEPGSPWWEASALRTSQLCPLKSPEGGKPDGLENPCGTAENQRTTQITYGPGQVSNQGHLGEGWLLYAQANNAHRWFPLTVKSVIITDKSIIFQHNWAWVTNTICGTQEFNQIPYMIGWWTTIADKIQVCHKDSVYWELYIHFDYCPQCPK